MATEDLDFTGNVGADQPGSVVFSGGVNGDPLTGLLGGVPTALTSGGDPILLTGFGTGTLKGFADTDGNGIDFGDPEIFRITLDPFGADTYTIKMFDTIDAGEIIAFTDFSNAPPGQNHYLGLDDPRDPAIDGPLDEDQDILFTAGTVPGVDVESRVNTSTTGIGVGNQTVSPNQLIRADFINSFNFNADTKDITTLIIASHYTVNGANYVISQTNPNGSRVDARVQVFDADENTIFTDDGPPLGIISIKLTDGAGVLFQGSADGTSTFDMSLSVDFLDLDNTSSDFDTVDVSGLLPGYKVFVTAASDYDRIEITNIGSNTFDLGGIEFGGTGDIVPVEMDFDLTVTDADLDTSTGTINVTLLPELAGDGGNNTLTGNGDPEFLVGLGGDDTLIGNGGDDFLIGGDGNDTLTGGTGADTFVFSLGANEGTDSITDFDFSDGDVLSFTDVVDIGGVPGIDDTDVIASYVDGGAPGAVDTVTLVSGTIINITDVDNAFTSADDVFNTTQINVA